MGGENAREADNNSRRPPVFPTRPDQLTSQRAASRKLNMRRPHHQRPFIKLFLYYLVHRGEEKPFWLVAVFQ